MRTLAVVLVMLAAVTWTTAVFAQQPSVQQLQQQINEMRTKLTELEAQLKSTQAAQKKAVQGEKVKVSGYVQARFTDEEEANSTFGVARARLKLAGQVTDRAQFTFQVDARSKDGKVDLRDAYIDYASEDQKTWSVRAGQAKVPIMYEVIESSGTRLAPERTAVARASFPGERDVGILFNYQPATWRGASLDVGIVNGQGRNANDTNNHKDLLARLLGPVGKGTAYLGMYDGRHTAAGVTTDKTRLAVGLEQALGPVALRGEWLRGDNLGLDMQGWYAQVACNPAGRPDTFFVRYDQYDENRDVANTTFKRTTVGWERQLDAKSRLTLAYEFKDRDAGFANVAADSEAVDHNALTAQFQVKY